MESYISQAQTAVDRCRILAGFSQEPGWTTRTFLSEPMRDVHKTVRVWMEQANMRVHVDPVGNIRGRTEGSGPCLYIGSHLDTVPRAGAFDGILGVMLGIALAESVDTTVPIEVLGFSEEEGVRFGVPFIGSRAFAGDRAVELLPLRDAEGVSILEAIEAFGLNPKCLDTAHAELDARGYLEFHIEQGPVLGDANLPVGLVDCIVGQSRWAFTIEGHANHAGTTPMRLRKDALVAAAEIVASVEAIASAIPGLVATVGKLEVSPGAGNVIPGSVRATLDVRHASDEVRLQAVDRIWDAARATANRRGVKFSAELLLDQPATLMDSNLTTRLQSAIAGVCGSVHTLPSGAGHDAMIVARRLPTAMLFLRSPGGISHHPDEAVLVKDVAIALQIGAAFVHSLEATHA